MLTSCVSVVSRTVVRSSWHASRSRAAASASWATTQSYGGFSSSDKHYAARTFASSSAVVEEDQELEQRLFDKNYRSEFKLEQNDFRPGRAAYLDLSATTPLDPRVFDQMMPWLVNSGFGNAGSRTHEYGWEAERAVETAREQIAALIGADTAKEVVFTSGATESNNLAIKGVARFYADSNKRHIITTQTEHKCVLDSCRALETNEGFDVTYLPVEAGTGRVKLEDVKAALRDDTLLVSVMAVNNELGTVQPIAEIGQLCADQGVFFHVDAAQMLGKLPLSVNDWKVDLMSMSSHKIYGPKGIGALYVRRRRKKADSATKRGPSRVRLEPLFSGGGQERGLRSGTLSTFQCVGMGAACALAQQEMQNDAQHIDALSRRLQQGIEEGIPHVTRNGPSEAGHFYPGCLNYSFAYVEGESLLMALKNIAVSSGSACTSASLEPSYVLRALGVEEDLAHSSLRIGMGRFTTQAEVDFVVDLLQRHVQRLRDMSPLWEMVQEGIDLKTIQWTQDHS